MNELIKIVENDGRKAVSARELHSFLEIKEKFSAWVKRMIDYGFMEGIDYVSLSENSEKPHGGRPLLDYAITIDTAKHWSMMQRNDKGMQARNYFIEIEKRATKPMSQLDILVQSVQILQAQEKRLAEVEDRVKVIEAKQTTHQNWFTIAGYGTLLKIQVGIKLAASLGRKACNLCKQLGVEPEEIPDPRFGKVKTYPENVLKQVFDMPIN